MQYKQNACSTGVYDVQCTDGNQAGLADFKRVQAMSARFRANQMSASAKAQAKYDAKLYARNISRCCTYEEELVGLANIFVLHLHSPWGPCILIEYF